MCRGPKRRTTSTNCRGSEKLYLRQARAYRPERRTVDGRNAKCFQSRQVALGGITFVTGKAVAGEFSIQQHHFPVAGHLGENRSEEHTSELQSRGHLACRILLE